MNKKLVFLFLSASTLAGFWACGKGDIINADGEDTLANLTAIEEIPTLPEKTLQEQMELSGWDGQADPTPVSSAADAPASSMSTPTVSSSSIAPPLPASSSSVTVIAPPVINSSASTPSTGEETPSPTPTVPTTATCAPANATINKGEAATWKVTPPTSEIFAFMDKAVAWTFEGAEPAESNGTGVNSANVTYANSGSFGATASFDGNTITCTPIQVNGSPITGCTCEPESPTVDVAVSGEAKWTIKGCTSLGANITTYTWSGAYGVEKDASVVLAAKGDKAAPKVTVENDDNTKIEVTCGEVTAVDSNLSDYILDANTKSLKLPAGGVTVQINIPKDQYHNCVAFCQGTQNISGTIGGLPISGQWHTDITIPKEMCTSAVEFKLDTEATCGIQ